MSVVGISTVSVKFNFDEIFKEELLNGKICFKDRVYLPKVQSFLSSMLRNIN